MVVFHTDRQTDRQTDRHRQTDRLFSHSTTRSRRPWDATYTSGGGEAAALLRSSLALFRTDFGFILHGI